MIYGLPESVELDGKEYEIRSDFRVILGIIEILNDLELTEPERGYLSLRLFFTNFDDIPISLYQEALKKMFWFINYGDDTPQEKDQPKLMDWEKDYQVIIAPVNRVLGHDARTDKHLHWWTFLGAYMEIGDCTFAQIVGIRNKLQKGEQLDKSDREWYRKNRNLVDLEKSYTSEDMELLEKWGGKQ